MVDECGVKDHEWVKDVYSKKLSWATAYIRGRFFAGIRTTLRCESLHAKLGRFVEMRYGILEFVTNFQRCVEFLRDNEDELEFRSSYGTPVIQTQFPELEKSGAMNFTREIFARYRDSLKRCVRVTVLGCIESDGTCVYVTQKYQRPEKRWNVTHHAMSDAFVYSCLRMESFGIPCVHILAVLVRLDIGSLPKSLVLQRWSKTAKVDTCAVSQVEDTKALYRNRVSAFLQHCKRFARIVCQSEEDFKVYTKKVVEDTLMLEMRRGEAGDGAGCSHAVLMGVRDPIGVRTKGTGRGNELAGSRAAKQRKCSTCGCLGHRRTRCPNGPRRATANMEQENVASQPMADTVPMGSQVVTESNKRRRRRD